jgi:hypothetical protein
MHRSHCLKERLLLPLRTRQFLHPAFPPTQELDLGYADRLKVYSSLLVLAITLCDGFLCIMRRFSRFVAGKSRALVACLEGSSCFKVPNAIRSASNGPPGFRSRLDHLTKNSLEIVLSVMPPWVGLSKMLYELLI